MILRAVRAFASITPRRCATLLAGVAVLLACFVQAADAYKLGGKRWPGKPARISYWNGTGYDDEVAAAVRAWNTSGVRVRFVRARRERADVALTSYDPPPGVLDGFGASGRASIGFAPFSNVRVSRGGEGAPIIGVIAHELGHVLGLVHETGQCAAMNSLPWVECGSERNCDILQPDDLRGAIRRYGGRARPGLAQLCPPPPTGLALSTLPGSYRAQLTFTLPRTLSVGGYGLRIGVGSCPPPDSGAATTRPARPGQTLIADVTPPGPDTAGRLLCVRLWSNGEAGRVGAASTTVMMEYRPDPLPPPSGLSVTGIRGGANLQWADVTHSALLGYDVAFLAGEGCPARPADAPEQQRNSFSSTTTGAGGVRMNAPPGRYCVAVWGRDYFGRLSATAATAPVDVPVF